MGVRRSGIGAGQKAVHAPVVVDAVHRPNDGEKQNIENGKKQKEKKVPPEGRNRFFSNACGLMYKGEGCGGLCARIDQ